MPPTLPDETAVEPSDKPAKKRPQNWLPAHEWKAANEMADQLNETEKQARRQIIFVIKDMGLEFAQTILQETLAIEAEGGMMLPDGSRRRTPGGVFFYLVRNRVPAKIRYQLFPKKPASSPVVTSKPTVSTSAFAWADRQQIVAPLLEAPGTVATVKAVLIGSPEHIKRQSEYVTFQLTEIAPMPAVAKGVPRPEPSPSTCTVYVDTKQWKRVEEAAADPEDALIIEGVCAYDSQSAGIVLYATSITSKRLQAKKRAQKT
ncbi:MAG: phosphorylated adapter RNA export RNA-binding domain-containing protein [Chloroflexota bacterium]